MPELKATVTINKRLDMVYSQGERVNCNPSGPSSITTTSRSPSRSVRSSGTTLAWGELRSHYS